MVRAERGAAQAFFFRSRMVHATSSAVATAAKAHQMPQESAEHGWLVCLK